MTGNTKILQNILFPYNTLYAATEHIHYDRKLRAIGFLQMFLRYF